MKKLMRITTVDFAQSDYMKGHHRYMKQYFEVIGLASDTGVLDSVSKYEGVRMINVHMDRKINIAEDLKSIIRFYHIFKKEKPYIVNSNSPKSSLLSMIAAKFAGVPNRIYTVSGLRYQSSSGLLRQILIMMERVTCFFSTIVIPEGQGVLNSLKKDKITSKPLNIIYNGNINGVNTNLFDKDIINSSGLREKLGIKADDFVFIYVGRIVRDKGMNELADAMKRIKNDFSHCKLLLVGDFEPKYGPLFQDTNDFLQNDPCVVYAGYVRDVRPFFAIADALVFPSYREGFPNVVLQAGAMGLCSLVTDINGSNEIIEDGLNGRIIPAKDSQSLYEMMKWFLNNQNSVKKMASCSRDIIKARYEQADVWAHWRDFYLSL